MLKPEQRRVPRPANLAGRLDDWRNPAAPRLLRRLARDGDEYVRAGAASSLGALSCREDLRLLRRMCRDSSAGVRREAVWAVGLYRRGEDIPLVKRMAADQCPKVRTVSALALTRLMRRAELESWLDLEDHRLSFEVLREVDFAIYAPNWVKKAEPRVGDDLIRIDLGMCRPGFGFA